MTQNKIDTEIKFIIKNQLEARIEEFSKNQFLNQAWIKFFWLGSLNLRNSVKRRIANPIVNQIKFPL